jgi:dienelactone hydrolase
LEVRQNLNEPPAIYVVGRTGSSRMLQDFAPHARDRKFGRLEALTWEDSERNGWDGLVAFPVNYQSGKQYPLLIQTHGMEPHTFFAEGPSTTAFPGRAALDRGFIVLTMNDTKYFAKVARATEPRVVLEGYRSAIAHLVAQGLVDPKRIGVIGWSRTSYYVKYTLTHAPELFRAAVCADGLDYSYLQYMLSLDIIRGGTFMPAGDFSSNYYSTYGGTPWNNFDSWRDNAPDFSVQKVQVPVRIDAASSRISLLEEWEFYAGLRYVGVPTDLIVYPQGQHELARPLDRMVSTEGSLDWIDYWINDHEDATPKKVAQYARWREMKDVWDAGAKKRCSTCLSNQPAARK